MIRRGVPDWAALPWSALHAPWLHRELVARLAPTYPAVIVDIPASGDAALAAWQALRALTPTDPAAFTDPRKRGAGRWRKQTRFGAHRCRGRTAERRGGRGWVST